MNRCILVMAWVMIVWPASFPAAMAAGDEQACPGIITGDVESTSYRVGMDIKALLERHNIHLNVLRSRGSVENIYAVYQRPGRHLGLVQSDVLAFVGRVKTDPRLKLIADKIKWVFPLYDQEVHILAAGEIRSFEDLHGRRVAIGHEESGACLTSQLLFEVSGVVPGRMSAMGNAQALAALKAGRIDAMVIVDGAPVERLALDVSAADGLHLIPIIHEGIRSFYPVSRIPAETYVWQTADVETVSVRAVLIAYDFRNHFCHTIGNVARLMTDNLNWLRFNGHPKWKSVDLNGLVKGWEQYRCVKNITPATVNEPAGPSCARRPNPVADAIQAVFRP